MTVCPNCESEIPLAARQCENCGAYIKSGHTTITHPEPVESDMNAVADGISPRPGMLALYVMGEEQPVLIRQQETVNIGRSTPVDREFPEVDLAPFQAHLRGVSRFHAQLIPTDEGYSLVDLDSTNGTWINETRLVANDPQPLNNGDMIRLGQFVMFAYFL